MEFFRLVPNDSVKKGAYFTHEDNTIHLDMRYGTWDGSPLCSMHEFGHWFDWHVRQRNNRKKKLISSINEFKEVADKDWERLSNSLEQNVLLARFGHGGRAWSGSYCLKATRFLFNKDVRELTMNEQYIITALIDIIQSITQGNYGWGHAIDDISGDSSCQEAFAEGFLLFATKNKKFRLDFPNMWEYFKNIKKKLTEHRKILNQGYYHGN